MSNADFMIGKRIRLIRVTDPYTKLVYGDEGTISHIDDMGTIHVKWDNGSNLGLSTEFGDAWVLLEGEQANV